VAGRTGGSASSLGERALILPSGSPPRGSIQARRASASGSLVRSTVTQELPGPVRPQGYPSRLCQLHSPNVLFVFPGAAEAATSIGGLCCRAPSAFSFQRSAWMQQNFFARCEEVTVMLAPHLRISRLGADARLGGAQPQRSALVSLARERGRRRCISAQEV
jgi:hypothetical protein